jgi:hypothetical protein
MTLPSGACDVPEPNCCSDWFTMANTILEVAHGAVVACQQDTACEQASIIGYVHVGSRTEDPTSDYVTVKLARVAPPFVADRDRKMVSTFPSFRATYVVSLLETGYPMVQDDGDEIFVPDPGLVHVVSAHSYAHGEAMYRALANAVANGTIGGDGCGNVRLGDLVPSGPSGGSAGWEATLEIEMRFGGS